MGFLKTRYEKGGDVTYLAATALLNSRLVKLVTEGVAKHMPKVGYTTASTDYSVGAVFADVAQDEEVGVSKRHGCFQLLDADAAIAFNVDVYPAAAGRVTSTAGGSTRPYGRSLHAVGAQDAKIWIKVY